QMIERLHKQAILYALFLVLHIGMIWLLPYFPTQDGPSHIYNLVILRDLISGGLRWGQYFDYEIFIRPSLGFNVVAYPLLAIFDPFVVEKIFISLYVILVAVSLPVFLRAGQKSLFPVSFLIFPVLFCYPVMMGFYSYIIGIPLLVLSLSIYWTIRTRSFWQRFVLINVAGFLLYWCHILIFLFFLTVLVGGLLIERAGIKPFTLRATQLGLCTVLPLICAICNVCPRLQNEGTRPMHVLPLRVLRRAAKNLMMLSIDNFSGAQVWSALLFGCLLLILVLVSGLMGYVGRSRLKELSHFERWLLCSTALLVLIYFLV